MNMKNKKTFLLTAFVFALILLSFYNPHMAFAQKKGNKVIIYFFWGDGCPHCEHEKPFLEKLKQNYPQVEIKAYETWHNKENLKLYFQLGQAFGVKELSVPATFLGDNVWRGYNDTIAQQIEAKVKNCIEHGCVDAITKINEFFPGEGIVPYFPRAKDIGPEEEAVVKLPIFGKIDASKISLPVFTVILGGLDGFNPCAFFVLLFLLGMLIQARSRARMLAIGGAFIAVSGAVYFVFMAAWLNLFLLIGQLRMITWIAGIIALVISLVNIKDFFFFKKGVSLTIPDKAKPKLFTRMSRLAKSSSLVPMITGTIILAIAANTYELLCTAGFPMVFTRALTLHKLSNLQYYLYLALYNLVYIVPLAVIVIIFTLTLGARQLTEWQGRVLKLISGLMMFGLGLVLLVRPAFLNNLFVAAGLLLLTLLITGIIVLITRVIDKRTKGLEIPSNGNK
ncbi:MAG: thioredoxin family protein [Candidatus Omnitrophica bacterium]|nr:thioredoxin family protein [Candidatus Omnitrophota bacterium]